MKKKNKQQDSNIRPFDLKTFADEIKIQNLPNNKIKFGLEQQGHIETIEQMLDNFGSNEYSWKKIGETIGWHPETACYHYVAYLKKKLIQQELTHENKSIHDDKNG